MPVYQTPKQVINELLALLRAHDWSSVGTVVFRKGPQRTIKLAGTEAALGIVALDELIGGEQSAGSGNNWWHEWAIRCAFFVPDDEAAPEATEDTRLDLIEEFGLFLHDNRTLNNGAKVGKITSCKLSVGILFENTTQVFRAADITVQYRTLRS